MIMQITYQFNHWLDRLTQQIVDYSESVVEECPHYFSPDLQYDEENPAFDIMQADARRFAISAAAFNRSHCSLFTPLRNAVSLTLRSSLTTSNGSVY